MKKYDLKSYVVITPSTKENGYNGYYEVPYVEYREDGSVLCKGTEDFSGNRLKSLKTYEIVANTGEKDKGGRNRWEHVGFITTYTKKEAIKISSFLYVERIIELRLL